MERRPTMKKNTLKCAGVVAVVAAVLASCYAPLANQNGYLNLGLQSKGVTLAGNEAVVLVVDSAYQDTLAETLNLIGKADINGSLSGSDQDRLKALGQKLATNGLVKFGGYPFYQITMSGTSGSFQIPGLPAGRSYLVKLIVLNSGIIFDVKDLDQNLPNLVLGENLVFTTEHYTTDTAWQTWTPNVSAGQPAPVNAGGSTAINVTIVPGVP
jgi:hypothetical protein